MSAPEKIWAVTHWTEYAMPILKGQKTGQWKERKFTDATEYTRTDLSQAAIAAASEAAADAVTKVAVKWGVTGEPAILIATKQAIRALITDRDRDALAAHVAAARAEDADMLYNAWLGLRVLESIAKVKGLSGAADVTTPLLAEIEAAHPEFAPRSALRTQIGAKP